ncbi:MULTISPECIES: DUF2884 family protein [Colwellia]|jgi:hypothetical protein|uniref:DUF2884 family protein n=1 Tax=Colwellia psychrerythraea (strain 34H / ATCC BAA-681) TaxID=167879 RepID=Q485I1_COLP3|nr:MULTISPECIES: DUF2884 family protein [Colwellia]AAZ26329.1 hypothetical protein CPS_1542 [Colwellia psychrerythraea 34H]PKH88770.1 DUF2884 domain-containing protein [Colwellia sp. Bg11-28]
MTYFHATLIASALTVSFASSAVYANKSCNVDLSAGLSINVNSIEFLQDEAGNDEKNLSLYKIIEGKKLLVDNQHIDLSDDQQALVKKYDEKIRRLVPQVKNVAIEGVDMAIEGVNLAFNGLLGEGNAVAADLTTELTLIREQVSTNLSIEHGVSVGVEGLESEGLLGKDFDKRIESAVEKAVLNSMGSILIAIGQQMVASEGDDRNFETRMESFGENIEHEMTTRSAIIEKKAEALCISIAEVDALEEQLKVEIEPLARINVFTVTQKNYEEESHPTAK